MNEGIKEFQQINNQSQILKEFFSQLKNMMKQYDQLLSDMKNFSINEEIEFDQTWFMDLDFYSLQIQYLSLKIISINKKMLLTKYLFDIKDAEELLECNQKIFSYSISIEDLKLKKIKNISLNNDLTIQKKIKENQILTDIEQRKFDLIQKIEQKIDLLNKMSSFEEMSVLTN